MFCGAALILTAMALLLRDVNYHYTSIGGLLVAGFSLWLIAACFQWAPNFCGFGGQTRSGYHIFNFFANILAIIGFALFVVGAALWLSAFGNPRYAGEILWIIASGFWVLSLLVRDFGLRYDAMNTYKAYPVLPTNATNNAVYTNDQKRGFGAHLSSVWSNAIATDLYLIASVCFAVGAIFFDVRGRMAPIDLYTSGQFQVAAGVLWIVGASIVILASIAHCVARR